MHESLAGTTYPLGATWDGAGVNFALFSEHATKVELCLFDSVDATARKSQRIALPEQTDQVWHAYLPDVQPASSTATGSTGPMSRPRAIASTPTRSSSTPTPRPSAATCSWDDALFGYKIGDPEADLSFDDRDNAAFAPLAAVVDPAFTWGDDRPPRTPWHKTLIYELHVKGFTKLHARRAREAARHLRRPGLGGGHQASDQTWASRPSS